MTSATTVDEDARAASIGKQSETVKTNAKIAARDRRTERCRCRKAPMPNKLAESNAAKASNGKDLGHLGAANAANTHHSVTSTANNRNENWWPDSACADVCEFALDESSFTRFLWTDQRERSISHCSNDSSTTQTVLTRCPRRS